MIGAPLLASSTPLLSAVGRTVSMFTGVIFQPELRRGLMLLGRYRGIRAFASPEDPSVVDRLTNLALALSRDRVGALIAVQREQSLAPYIETGERLKRAPGRLTGVIGVAPAPFDL